jgi:hypothetical protein
MAVGNRGLNPSNTCLDFHVPRRRYALLADSDEVARAFRDDVARDYEMMSPRFGASLACVFFALGRCRSSVSDCVQSRPYPRGGTTAVSSSRSSSTIACSASPVTPSRKVSGSASSQAAYSPCKATSTDRVAPAPGAAAAVGGSPVLDHQLGCGTGVAMPGLSLGIGHRPVAKGPAWHGLLRSVT